MIDIDEAIYNAKKSETVEVNTAKVSIPIEEYTSLKLIEYRLCIIMEWIFSHLEYGEHCEDLRISRSEDLIDVIKLLYPFDCQSKLEELKNGFIDGNTKVNE